MFFIMKLFLVGRFMKSYIKKSPDAEVCKTKHVCAHLYKCLVINLDPETCPNSIIFGYHYYCLHPDNCKFDISKVT